VDLPIPRLTTERLVLRAPRADDLDPYAAMTADPEVMRYVGQGVPLDRGGAWRQLATFLGGWVMQGFGQWAVERRADGAFLGRAGLWFPPGWPEVEVGWALAREHWGRGYATEAAAAAVAWAGPGRALVALIHPDNAASIRVARKLGFAFTNRMGAADVYANSGSPSSGVEARA
jgi:RimJ/RimL family protein N-acetyltransferase